MAAASIGFVLPRVTTHVASLIQPGVRFGSVATASTPKAFPESTSSLPAASVAAVAASAVLLSQHRQRQGRGAATSAVRLAGMAGLISKEQALSGRSDEMPVSSKHHVLKNPMRGPWPAGHEICVFANGCFWGSEKAVWRLPGSGIYSTAVGYAAGYTKNPTYEECCSGRTGSTEAVQVVFDPSKISIVDILRMFWQAHDPTQGMGQGNDRGTQYRSGIYYHSDDQRIIFEASRDAYQKALKAAGRGRGGVITTEIAAASDYEQLFYYGEDYHQQYLAKPGARPYCSAQPQEVSLPPFEEWCPKGMEKYAPKLPEEFWKKHAPGGGCKIISQPNEIIKWP